MVISLAIAMTTAQVTQSTCRVEKSEDTPHPEVIFQTGVNFDSGPPTAVEEREGPSQEFRIDVQEVFEEWTPQLEREYRALVARGAVGSLDKAGFQRLQRLQSERRNLKNPRPVAEIIEDARMYRATEALLKAFDNYAQHRKASPWKSAQESVHKSS
jgi:hypothetical protein